MSKRSEAYDEYRRFAQSAFYRMRDMGVDAAKVTFDLKVSVHDGTWHETAKIGDDVLWEAWLDGDEVTVREREMRDVRSK